MRRETRGARVPPKETVMGDNYRATAHTRSVDLHTEVANMSHATRRDVFARLRANMGVLTPSLYVPQIHMTVGQFAVYHLLAKKRRGGADDE